MLFKNLSVFGLTKFRINLFIILTVLSGFFEGFGMAMFLPVLEFVEKGQDITLLENRSQLWERLVGVFKYLGLDITLAALLSVAISFMLLRVIFIYLRDVYAVWLSQQVLHTTRCNLFQGYMALCFGTMAEMTSGGIINVLTTETQRVGSSFNSLFTMASNFLVIVGFFWALLWLSAPLTLFSVVLVGLSVGFAAYYSRHTRSYSHKATKANADFSRKVLERLGAFRLIKLSASGEREAGVLQKASDSVRLQMYRLARINAGIGLVMEPMMLLTGGAILYFGVTILSMSLAEVGLFLVIMLRMLPLAKKFMQSNQNFRSNSGSLAAVLGGYEQVTAHREIAGGDRTFTGVQETICLEKVTFKYSGSETPALSNISLDIPAGKVTALVGPSGAGKTTLADIIPRLRLPQQGRVLYDGIEGEAFDLASLRRGMAFVSQDAAILDDTVAGNLRFAKPEATEKDIWDALERAQAAQFVCELSQGLQTRLGERGTLLSGGQKQRLSLARALLQGTNILILDEPTSALDSETERDIQLALDELQARSDMTVIIIAHRLSTIRGADKIVVLKNGQVMEQGSHKELTLSEEWYALVSGMQAGLKNHSV